MISFTIEFFVIQRRIVNKTLSKNRKTTISFDHNKKKKIKNEMMIVISLRASDVNLLKKH